MTAARATVTSIVAMVAAVTAMAAASTGAPVISQTAAAGGIRGRLLLSQAPRVRIALGREFRGLRRHGVIQSMQLGFDRIARQEAARNSKTLVVNDQRFTYGDAG